MKTRTFLELLANIALWSILILLFLNLFVQQAVEIDIVNGNEVIKTSYDTTSVLFHTSTLPLKIAFYYLNLYVFSRYFDQKSYLKYIFALLLGMAFLSTLEFHINKSIFEQPRAIKIEVLSTVTTYFFLACVSFAHLIIIRWSQNEEMKQVLREEQINNELLQLKAQLNPHFLFNALNNLLSLAEKSKQSEISEGIINLSEMLRFSIHEMVETYIPLSKEIAFIEHYIKLTKMRYEEEDPIDIQVILKDIEAESPIAPLVFFPFVENALKHGLDIERESFVHINISMFEGKISFEVENSVHPKKHRNSGIGLKNVKKRLDLLYKNKHELNILQDGGSFSVQLIIDKNV